MQPSFINRSARIPNATRCACACGRAGEVQQSACGRRRRACVAARGCVRAPVRAHRCARRVACRPTPASVHAPVCARVRSSDCGWCARLRARAHACAHARAAPHAQTDAPTRAHKQASVHAGVREGSNDRRHAPVLVLRVHVGAVREQRRRHVRVPAVSGVMERRPPAADRARAHTAARSRRRVRVRMCVCVCVCLFVCVCVRALFCARTHARVGVACVCMSVGVYMVSAHLAASECVCLFVRARACGTIRIGLYCTGVRARTRVCACVCVGLRLA